MHIKALRGIERYGVGNLEQAFTAYTALPAGGQSSASPSWWEVLGCAHDTDVDEVIRLAGRAVRRHHPDTGDGDVVRYQLALEAFRQARKGQTPNPSEVRP